MKKQFRIPDKLPKLKGRLPEVGELLFLQDLDGSIQPVIILQLVYEKSKKGKNLKRLLEIKILSGCKITTCLLHDLKVQSRYMPE